MAGWLVLRDSRAEILVFSGVGTHCCGLSSVSAATPTFGGKSGRTAATRKDIIKGSAALLLPSLWWITFPLRFLSGQHFWDVVIGLAAAATVLTFGAWMVIRLIKAFERSDLEDLKALDSADAELAGKESSSKK
jgi:hypothetical protein